MYIVLFWGLYMITDASFFCLLLCDNWQSMIELSRTQDEEVGDGTTSVIVLGVLCDLCYYFVDWCLWYISLHHCCHLAVDCHSKRHNQCKIGFFFLIIFHVCIFLFIVFVMFD